MLGPEGVGRGISCSHMNPSVIPPNMKLEGHCYAPRGTHIRVALKAVCCDISRMGRACRRVQGWFFRLPSKTLAQSLSFIMWLTTFPQTVTEYFRRHISITVMLLKTFFFFSFALLQDNCFYTDSEALSLRIILSQISPAYGTKEAPLLCV